MSILISTTKSKVAHLSWDGESTVCGTILPGDTLRGKSLGFVKAEKACQHCNINGAFYHYFDELRREQFISAERSVETNFKIG